MKLYIFSFLLAAVIVVESKHTFLGTSVLRPIVYHHQFHYSAMVFRKRVENLTYTIPNFPYYYGRRIQGILAYDLTHSGATANVTMGGLGFNFVNIRMMSDYGMDIRYDIYIYA